MRAFDLPAQLARSRRSMELESHAVREDYLPDGVGNAAVLGLGEALIGWIVGVDEGVARPIVARSRDWLLDAVARGEQFGASPESFAAVRIEALAVASWALGETSREYYAVALDLQDEAFAALGLSDEAVRDGYLEDYLVDCALAGEYQRGVDASGRYGHDLPPSESLVSTPLELAAWICGARAADPGCEPVEQPTAARILRDPFVRWLTNGDGITAAAWAQLIFGGAGAEADASSAFAGVRGLVTR